MSCVPVLSLFTIVSFKNEACLSSGTGTNGTCYSSNECAKLGGTSSGTCASGFGVCCLCRCHGARLRPLELEMNLREFEVSQSWRRSVG